MDKEKAYTRAIAQIRDSIGKVYYPGLNNEPLGRLNEVATRDQIRHFANSIGDTNPLWRDPEYARSSKYGHIIAPPLFLNAFYHAIIPLVPGTFAMPTGLSCEWFKP